MRKRVTVVTLSVSQSVCHFFILEKAPFSGLKLTSVHSRRRFKSFKCSTFFEKRSYFGEKASGTSAVTSVIYWGNAQSLNGLHVIF